MHFLGSDNEIHETPNPPKPCPRTDYTGYWYGCYKKHIAPGSWNSAKSTCENEDAYLVTIIADAENAAMELFTTNDDLPVWTGGRDVAVR